MKLQTTTTTFHLHLNNTTYPIIKIIGEEALSKLFRFELDILLPYTTPTDQLQFCNAILIATLNNQNQLKQRKIFGIISSIIHFGVINNEQIHLRLILEPRLSLLKKAKTQQLFLDQTVVQITRTFLLRNGYENPQLYFQCDKNIEAKPYTLQAPGESDLAFLQRILAYAGICFWCDSENDQEIIYFSDHHQGVPYSVNNKISYLPPSCLNKTDLSETELGYFYQMQIKTSLVAQEHTVQNFNEQNKYYVVAATQKYPTTQNLSIHQDYFGTGVNSVEAAQSQALFRAQHAAIEAWQLYASGNSMLIKPGTVIALNAWHFNADNNYDDNYLIISVKHFFNQNTFIYHNEVVMVRASTIYRDAIPAIPRFPSCWISRIESTGDYPYLDEQGRYRLRHHFDLSNKPNTEATPPIYRLSNHSGLPEKNSVGVHLPLSAGTDVLISCLNGDIDYPVIIGALTNALFNSAVTSANRTQNILITQAKNLLLFDDAQGQEKIQLATENSGNLIELNNSAENNKIMLSSQKGEIALNANGNIQLQNNDNCAEECKNNRIHSSKNHYCIQTIKHNIEYTAQTNQSLLAKQTTYFNGHENIIIKSGNNLIISVGDGLNFSVNNSECCFEVMQGKMRIHAAGSINIFGTGKSAIQFSNRERKIIISPEGGITVTANMINLEAASGVFLNGQVNME